jgi:hypothetical protein
MKRTIITVGGNGMLSIPSNLENLWMSESELVDMLYVTAPKLKAVLRAIYKEGMLSMLEVQQREELSKGVWQTLYGFPMIVAICFHLTSNGATQLRDAIFKRLYGAKEKTAIVLQLYGGTNYFGRKTIDYRSRLKSLRPSPCHHAPRKAKMARKIHPTCQDRMKQTGSTPAH